MKKFAAAIFMAAVALLVGFDLGLAQEAAEAATGGDGNYLKAAIFIGSCIGAGVGILRRKRLRRRPAATAIT